MQGFSSDYDTSSKCGTESLGCYVEFVSSCKRKFSMMRELYEQEVTLTVFYVDFFLYNNVGANMINIFERRCLRSKNRTLKKMILVKSESALKSESIYRQKCLSCLGG